jgi:ABC-type multidrug transport system ATPase subunit
MPEPAVEIRGLQKAYPQFTLGPLDLTVPAGAIYGFVGPNASGKTTTIDLLFGMGDKDAGTIKVFGLDHLRDEVAVKRQVGYVSPDLDFRPWQTIGKAIAFVRGFYPRWDDRYCETLLGSLHLGIDDRITTLSFGSRIKLALILALSWRPRLLVLDEPTVGLDAIARQQIFAELLAAVEDGDRTVFISSHAISDLERLADHVGMIKQGKLVFEGQILDLLERYRMVDFAIEAPIDVSSQPGVVVQDRRDGRWRVLIDRQRTSLDWLTGRGARQISEAPVSLEELFVALGRD